MLRHIEYETVIKTDLIFTSQGIYSLSSNSDNKEVMEYVINVAKEEQKSAVTMPLKKGHSWGFPGGSVVKIPCIKFRGIRLDPWLGKNVRLYFLGLQNYCTW